MPTTVTKLTDGGASTNTSFNTASVSPGGSRLILVSVHAYISTGSAQPAAPAVTGNGITYTLEKSQSVDAAGADRATLFVFRGMAASPSAGAITISFGAVTMTRCQWVVEEVDGIDTSGTNGSGAIVQTAGATTASGALEAIVNFDFAMAAGNSAYAAFGHQVQEVKTPRAGWTESADVTVVSLASLQTQYIIGTDTAASATWVSGSRAGGIVLELVDASAPNTPEYIGNAGPNTGTTSIIGPNFPAASTDDWDVAWSVYKAGSASATMPVVNGVAWDQVGSSLSTGTGLFLTVWKRKRQAGDSGSIGTATITGGTSGLLAVCTVRSSLGGLTVTATGGVDSTADTALSATSASFQTTDMARLLCLIGLDNTGGTSARSISQTGGLLTALTQRFSGAGSSSCRLELNDTIIQKGTNAALTFAATMTSGVGLVAFVQLEEAAPAGGTLDFGLPVGTDTALDLAFSKDATLGLPVGTDSALTLDVSKSLDLGLPVGTDSALGMTTDKAVALGLPIEDAVAFEISVSKNLLFGLPTSAESALGMDFAAEGSVSLNFGLPIGTDSALGMDATKELDFDLAIEDGVALAMTFEKAMDLGLTTEDDQTWALEFNKTWDLGLVIGTDVALAMTIGAESDEPVLVVYRGHVKHPVVSSVVVRGGVAIPVTRMEVT